jgi:hypothetical protein
VRTWRELQTKRGPADALLQRIPVYFFFSQESLRHIFVVICQCFNQLHQERVYISRHTHKSAARIPATRTYLHTVLLSGFNHVRRNVRDTHIPALVTFEVHSLARYMIYNRSPRMSRRLRMRTHLHVDEVDQAGKVCLASDGKLHQRCWLAKLSVDLQAPAQTVSVRAPAGRKSYVGSRLPA